MKVSFHKTFHHLFWWTKKKTHPSPTNLLLFFLGQFHFLEPTKKRSWLCFNRALFGLSRLPTGWMGHVVFHGTGFVEPRWLRQLLTTTKASKQGMLSWVFLGCFELPGFYGKKHGMAKNRPKFSYILIYTYIYWYTHVINTLVMLYFFGFLKIIKNQQYIYYTLQN